MNKIKEMLVECGKELEEIENKHLKGLITLREKIDYMNEVYRKYEKIVFMETCFQLDFGRIIGC